MARTAECWRRVRAALLLGCLVLVADGAGAASVTVSAAASATNILTETARAFEANGPDRVRLSFAASSTLARQIINGAEVDIFLSANVAWMDTLEQRGLLVAGTRRDLLGNRLVLIAPVDSPLSMRIAADMPLGEALLRLRLAIADPAHVPAGIYARQALRHFGLWDGVHRRLVFSASVRQALAYVARGEVAAGIVYASDAAISPRVRVLDTFPPSSHAPIRYPLARLKARPNDAADRFLVFLRSADAIAIYKRYGFEPLVKAVVE